jgi:small subunit ribosomal protein S18
MPQRNEADSEEGGGSKSYVLYFSYLTRWFVQVFSFKAANISPNKNTGDPPPRVSATSDHLAALGDAPSSSSPSTSSTPTPAFTNPIQRVKMKNLPGNSTASRAVTRLLQVSDRKERERRAGRITRSSDDVEELRKYNMAADLSKQITRRWKAGDVYAPHDLSEVEMAKWKKRDRPNRDAFDVLDFNPMDHYRVRTPLLHPFYKFY